MIIDTYATEQVARHHRQEREADAAASRQVRVARQARGTRIAPSAGASDVAPGTVRIPRPRRWVAAVVSSVR